MTDGDGYVAIASMGGQPTNPVWYLNLVADPHVTLQDGPTVRDYMARTTEGVERERLWKVAVGVYPEYEDYQARCERTNTPWSRSIGAEREPSDHPGR